MEAYVFEAVRTPRGAARETGALRHVRPIDLLATLYRALEERGVPGSEVDDIALGCVTATGDQGANIAKISALHAGYSQRASGVTLNRFCASGLDAVHHAAAKVGSSMADLVVAGGVESMSRVPLMSDGGAWFSDPDVARKTGYVHMGISADLVATLGGFTRDDVDAYAVESHRRAALAARSGWFSRSLVPVRDASGAVLLDRDERIREGMTPASLAKLEPAFAALGAAGADAVALSRYPEISAVQHVHHAGCAPGMADGASLLVIGSLEKGRSLGLRPRAKIRAFADACVEPVIMLTAPAPAAQKALARAGLSSSDVDLWEINESFSAVVLDAERRLGVDPSRVNVNGGAIAMGHPLGATGGVLLSTLLDELERRGLATGVVAMCAGAGIGAATVIERV